MTSRAIPILDPMLRKKSYLQAQEAELNASVWLLIKKIILWVCSRCVLAATWPRARSNVLTAYDLYTCTSSFRSIKRANNQRFGKCTGYTTPLPKHRSVESLTERTPSALHKHLAWQSTLAIMPFWFGENRDVDEGQSYKNPSTTSTLYNFPLYQTQDGVTRPVLSGCKSHRSIII